MGENVLSTVWLQDNKTKLSLERTQGTTYLERSWNVDPKGLKRVSQLGARFLCCKV